MPDYDRRIADLERNMRAIPSRFAGGGGAVFYVLAMRAGNIVATYGTRALYGCANTATPPTVVPTAVPSKTSGATPDNLSPAYLYGPNSRALVWAATSCKPGGLGDKQQDLYSIIPFSTTFVTFRTVQMQVAATGVYVPVYLTGRLA